MDLLRGQNILRMNISVTNMKTRMRFTAYCQSDLSQLDIHAHAINAIKQSAFVIKIACVSDSAALIALYRQNKDSVNIFRYLSCVVTLSRTKQMQRDTYSEFTLKY